MFAHAFERSTLRGVVTALALTVAAGTGVSAQMPKHEMPMQTTAMNARPDTLPPKARRRAVINVTSASWFDAHVYVIRDGLAISLGMVSGPGESALQVPSMATGSISEVQLMVLPIGSQEYYMSPVMAIEPGATIDLTIENNLSLSHVEVQPPR